MAEAEIEYLYKYRSVSGESSCWVKKLLLDDEIYFPSPTEFDDPFDCLPIVSNDASQSELARHFRDLVRRVKPHWPRPYRRHWLRDQLRSYDSASALAFLDGEIRNLLNSVGVFSLSAKCDDIHMWSLYADKHRGICLRFQASDTTPFFGRAQAVRYHADRPILNVIRDDRVVQSERSLLTKADFWKYQEEWRIIEHDTGPGKYKFPSALLDGVILGAKISDEDRQKVLQWVIERGTTTEILQAQIDPRQFRLQIVRRAD